MQEIHCYVSKGKFDAACRKEWDQQRKWKKVIKEMADYMGEHIKSIYTTPSCLGFPQDTISSFQPEHKKLFRKNGMLKQNGKGSASLRKFYKRVLAKYGLEFYQSISDLRLDYSLYRYSDEQGIYGYRDFDGRCYLKCNFVPAGAEEHLTEISEMTYMQTYTVLLREQEKRKQKA